MKRVVPLQIEKGMQGDKDSRITNSSSSDCVAQ